MKNGKIVLIGSGAVGTSAAYSCLNRGIGSELVIIDVFENVAKGNELDLEDAMALMPRSNFYPHFGSYADASDAEIVIVTAGRPQKSADESRLELLKSNVGIIAGIAKEIKKSGFSGVSIVASNPCDILTSVYQKAGGFPVGKVLSAGTYLDSGRFALEIARAMKSGTAQDYRAYLIGEHGDSSVPFILDAAVEEKLSDSVVEKAAETARQKAYKIIELKRATFYGIGVSLSTICDAVMHDAKTILPVGPYHKESGIYYGYPSEVSAAGACPVEGLKIPAKTEKALSSCVKMLEGKVKEALELL